MTPERWQKVRELLHGVLQLSVLERSAFLDSKCSSNPSLREEVEFFLSAEKELSENFLECPTAPEISCEPGTRLGAYEIQAFLGSGGMGEVYQALDTRLKRTVAIKLLPPSLFHGVMRRRYFRTEARAISVLQHPNICTLYDVGQQDGTDYLVMELIDGLRIDEYCNQRKLAIAERLTLFRQVCSAVHYAHQHLIIHRDLKPGNILVTPEGVPKLLDFGIAKIIEPNDEDVPTAGPTLTLHRALTPAYASPEQIRGATITTASDLYSLAVVLYELLTECLPYPAALRTPQEITRAVCEIEPEKPSAAVLRGHFAPDRARSIVERAAGSRPISAEKWSRMLKADLDNILLMALRKEPERRYVSVDQFSEDIRRHLEHLPVSARKASFGYRARTFATRHKVALVAGSFIAATLLTVIGLLLHENRFAREQAEIARNERTRAERHFQEIRELSDSLMFDIHDSIQVLPGSTPARKMLVSKALNYLDRLSSEAAGDKDLQRKMATVYEKIATVQGNPFDANLGDFKESIQGYQKAATIWEVLAKGNPPDPIDVLGLARTYRQLSGVIANTGGSDPLALALKAVEVCEKLKEVDSSAPQVWEELERDHEMAAAIQVRTGGDPRGALENLQKALQIIEQHKAAPATEESVATRVALVEKNIGEAMAELGRWNRASEHFRTGVTKLQSEPKRSDLETTMALLQSRWGDILMMRGDATEALRKYRLNRELLAPLAAADPRNVDLQLELAFAYARLGHALSQEQDENEALADLQKALTLFDPLVSQTGYSQARHGLACSHFWIGQVLQSKGDITRAIQHYRKTQEQYVAITTAMPWDRYYQAGLAGSRRITGDALVAMGKTDQAEQEYQKASEVVEPLVTSQPGNVLAWCTLADIYFGLGEGSRFLATRAAAANVAMQRSNWLTARRYYQQSLDAWEHVPHPGVSTSTGFPCRSPHQAAQALSQADAAIRQLPADTAVTGS